MEYHPTINCQYGMEYLKFGINFTGKDRREAFHCFYDNLQIGINYYTADCDNQDEEGFCKGHEDGSIPRTAS